MTTNRIHDIEGLKALIKTSASETRKAREEARKLTGLDRHWAKADAEDPDARDMHLAYGYLRGRTIEQMESAFTRTDNLPNAAHILAHARPYFMKGPDAPEWDETTKKQIPVEDDRSLMGKILGRPTPEPKTITEYHKAPDWEEFAKRVTADIKVWKAKLIGQNAIRQAQKAGEEGGLMSLRPDMESRPGIQRYREWELRMAAVREKHRGPDSIEEDNILDEFDDLWWDFSAEERDYLNTTTSPHHDALVRWL